MANKILAVLLVINVLLSCLFLLATHRKYKLTNEIYQNAKELAEVIESIQENTEETATP